MLNGQRLQDPFSNNSFYGITGEAIAFVVASALKESGEIGTSRRYLMCLFSQRSAALIDDFHALVTRQDADPGDPHISSRASSRET